MIRLEGAGERQAALDAMQARIEGLVKQRDRAKVRQKPPALLAARTAQVERAKAQRKRLLETPLPKPPKQGSSLSGQRVPLDSSIAQNETMNQAIQSHHRAISTLNKQLESTRQCPQTDAPDQAQYVGSVACQGCHQEAYALWKKTPHAKAWATLEHKGRTYDYTCVGCHSAGFEQPGGFCRVSEAGARVNVGCESCHGPGSVHNAQAGKGRSSARCQPRTAPSAITLLTPTPLSMKTGSSASSGQAIRRRHDRRHLDRAQRCRRGR